jgi:hypothetical protein
MPAHSHQNHAQPPESEVRDILKALDSSGLLKDIDSISEADVKSRLVAELARQGLGHISPDRFWYNSNHWFFIVPKK